MPSKRLTDPYDQSDQGEAAPVQPTVGDPSSYTSTTLNPVYRGLPWVSFYSLNGEIVGADAVTTHEIGEKEKKAKAIETMRRMKRRNPEQATTNQEPTDD